MLTDVVNALPLLLLVGGAYFVFNKNRTSASKSTTIGTYNASQRVLIFFYIVGWILVGLGALLLLQIFTIDYNVFFSVLILSSLGMVLSGIMMILFAQLGLAQIATAENSDAIYELLKKNLINSTTETNSNIRDEVVHTTNRQDGVRAEPTFNSKAD
ncbi:hypothetical protein [Lentibacter algarum]|uniref:hypothetical protein n=1 Tax=Lentibacter algarum TaxID=576131 RepID=UPI00339D4EB3